MPSLDSLRVFVTAARRRSFSSAAVDLGLAQPTISRIIKELEQEWNQSVFHRTGRGVALSEFGEVALARAEGLLRDADQLTEDLRSLSRSPVGQVSIGIPPSMVAAVIPALVQSLQVEAPGVRLYIREGFSDQIERWLANGDVEIGLVSKYRETGQRAEPWLFTSPLVLARSASLGPMPPAIDFAEVEGKPLVLPMHPNGLRVAVETVARRLRFALNVVVDAESILAQKLIAEKCGCYMIKAAQTLTEIPAGTFATSLLGNPGLYRYIIVQTTQQRPISRAAREVASRVSGLVRGIPSDVSGTRS